MHLSSPRRRDPSKAASISEVSVPLFGLTNRISLFGPVTAFEVLLPGEPPHPDIRVARTKTPASATRYVIATPQILREITQRPYRQHATLHRVNHDGPGECG